MTQHNLRYENGRWEGRRKAQAPRLEREFGGRDPRLTGQSPKPNLGMGSLPSDALAEASARRGSHPNRSAYMGAEYSAYAGASVQ